MKISLFFVGVFAITAVVYGFRNPPAALIFAGLAVYWAVPPFLVWRNIDGDRATPYLLARLGIALLAMALFFALVVSTPTKGAFWIMLVGVIAIGAPVVILGARWMRTNSASGGNNGEA